MSALAAEPIPAKHVSTPVFLSAQWRHLVVQNFEVDPRLLADCVPRGVELDTFEGRTFVSMVGFLFLDTRLFGFSIPGHRQFEEVNLRFYVVRDTAAERRRGVVFIKELVPRRAVATVARWFYNENYRTFPMRHEIIPADNNSESPREVSYSWRRGGRGERLVVDVGDAPWSLPAAGSLDEFIIEHYWGYSVQRDGSTMEYEVTHPRWRIAPALNSTFDCEASSLYGRAFGRALAAEPASAFLVDGSAVEVHRGVVLSRETAGRAR